jgi:glutamine amidotransferase-like uncharacterized protein
MRFIGQQLFVLTVAFLWVVGTAAALSEDRKLEVAVFDDTGVGPSGTSLVKVLKRCENIRVSLLDGADIREGALDRFDVFMAPGGSGRGEARSLEESGREEVKRYVRNGGCYVGICAGCYLATNATDYLGLLPVGIRDRRHWHRGKAVLPIEFTAAGKAVLGMEERRARIVYHNGPVLNCEHALEAPELMKNFVPLAYFRDEIVARGGERGVMKGAPAMVLARYGKGLVLGISPHPEQTKPLNRILPHALEWLHAHVDKPGTIRELVEEPRKNSATNSGIREQASKLN